MTSPFRLVRADLVRKEDIVLARFDKEYGGKWLIIAAERTGEVELLGSTHLLDLRKLGPWLLQSIAAKFKAAKQKSRQTTMQWTDPPTTPTEE